MIPILLNEDNSKGLKKMSLLLSFDSTKTHSNSTFSFIKKRRDTKFSFGFLKRSHTDGSIKDSVSVRPLPEEAAKWSNSFLDLVNSKYGQALFKAFLRREFCEENLEFWLAIEDYRKASQSKLSNKAQKIYNEFIVPHSPKEINLDSLTRDDLATKMSQTPTYSTFDSAQRRTQVLLEADAYPRFLKSDLYLELRYPERYSRDSF